MEKKTNTTISKFNSLIALKKLKSSADEIDSTFFCFENLPVFGKEFWFMKFVSKENKDKRQLLVMFGNAVGNLKINKKEIKCKKDKNGNKNGYMTVWCYDEEKHLIFEDECTILINQSNILAINKQNKIKYSGNFPSYSLNLFKDKEFCNLKITKPENNSNYFEFRNFFKSFLGYTIINLYFDFKGILNNKKFEGKCYVQKVIVIGPFVPWYWGRIVFSNGSILNYHEPRIEAFGLKYKLRSLFEFYDNEKNKKYRFNDVKIIRFGKKNQRWIITANKGNFFVCIKTYSSHIFEFKKIGCFTYIEYLAKITDIFIENENVDVKKLGSGFGLIEDAYGYFL
ncbi:MAG: hypothetical protein B6U87_01535 [Candidatus Aenigmarchaeota archaeon ex4484_52]|nr:MAG: hypothetical protein B6U87_01535 [Candidatus Aenigmarchaeota archaeon ex4484_52]